MGDPTGLFKIAMLALIFNIVMFGVFSFVSAEGLDTIDCPEETEFSGNFTLNACQPEGLPFWFYAIWFIINGGLIYAFIPFI